ncbi:hypothetical protein C4564_00030 [Candidatus Microgenomates bacterium]|nr:MAG: hypothetical protein C4564_00030 [Candidatus Microgenomates bacterium]
MARLVVLAVMLVVAWRVSELQRSPRFRLSDIRKLLVALLSTFPLVLFSWDNSGFLATLSLMCGTVMMCVLVFWLINFLELLSSRGNEGHAWLNDIIINVGGWVASFLVSSVLASMIIAIPF